MRQLLPEVRAAVDPDQAYADDERVAPAAPPWLLLHMIASVDGATAVEGRTGPLGGPADRAVFRSIRALADVILVGGGTARAERYGPPVLPPDLRAARRRRGQPDLPRLAIVSRRLDLDAIVSRFDPAAPRPIVVTTTDSPGERRRDLQERAEVITCGERTVDLRQALITLRGRWGADVVVAEGGPHLNGTLTNAGLVEELCLTLAPSLAGGATERIVHGADAQLRPLTLSRVLEEDGYLFLRYVRARETPS